MKLNLTATNEAERRILDFLENNVTEAGAEKINQGVRLEKDGTPVISKKTLAGFWKYATEEARKVAEKGATSAYVADDTVFGWAIHYFEEDSIEELLFTESGEPYKPPKQAAPPMQISAPTIPPKKHDPRVQMSLFDLLAEEETSEEDAEETEVISPIITDDTHKIIYCVKKISTNPLAAQYALYTAIAEKHKGRLVVLRADGKCIMYGESAKKAEKVLGLPCTVCDVGAGNEMQTSSFPDYAMLGFIEEMEKKYPLVIAESEEVFTLYPPPKDAPPPTLPVDDMGQVDEADLPPAMLFEPTALAVLESMFGKSLITR